MVAGEIPNSSTINFWGIRIPEISRLWGDLFAGVCIWPLVLFLSFLSPNKEKYQAKVFFISLGYIFMTSFLYSLDMNSKALFEPSPLVIQAIGALILISIFYLLQKKKIIKNELAGSQV